METSIKASRAAISPQLFNNPHRITNTLQTTIRLRATLTSPKQTVYFISTKFKKEIQRHLKKKFNQTLRSIRKDHLDLIGFYRTPKLSQFPFSQELRRVHQELRCLAADLLLEKPIFLELQPPPHPTHPVYLSLEVALGPGVDLQQLNWMN